jgi:DNA-binding LytR/AlgR family response regulator
VRPEGLTVLAVDDERSQLDDLARLLRSSPIVEEVECASDGQDALVKASAHHYDAIFLDVRMPDLDGVQLGRVLRRFAAPPALVFVSAYESAAVDAFELRAFDYLLKPVGRRRLEEALERVAGAVHDVGDEFSASVARPAERGPGSGTGSGLGSGSGDREVIAVANLRGASTRLISRGSVVYLQSHGDFVRVVTADGRYLLRATLADVAQRWEPFGFVRVHRQYVANLHHAVEVRPQLGGTAQLAFGDGETIPIARRQVAELGRRLGV